MINEESQAGLDYYVHQVEQHANEALDRLKENDTEDASRELTEARELLQILKIAFALIPLKNSKVAK